MPATAPVGWLVLAALTSWVCFQVPVSLAWGLIDWERDRSVVLLTTVGVPGVALVAALVAWLCPWRRTRPGLVFGAVAALMTYPMGSTLIGCLNVVVQQRSWEPLPLAVLTLVGVVAGVILAAGLKRPAAGLILGLGQPVISVLLDALPDFNYQNIWCHGFEGSYFLLLSVMSSLWTYDLGSVLFLALAAGAGLLVLKGR